MTRDELDIYIQRIREQFDKACAQTGTRSLAMGYAFGRADQRLLDGSDPPEDGHGGLFADYYEQHTNGSWTDLGRQYDAFLKTRKEAP